MRGKLMLGLFIIGISTPIGAALPRDTHPFSVHDLVEMDRLAEPQVSPDGKWMVFTVSKLDLEANRRRTDLWLIGFHSTLANFPKISQITL